MKQNALKKHKEWTPIFKPLLQKEEYEACKNVLREGWLGMGRFVGEFENRLHTFLGLGRNRFVVAVNTGHSALHLGLLVAGVGPGDEVITPSFNNATDFQAILVVGAKPVFCDIDDKTLCIDIKKAERLISSRTKAIIIMDYGCMLCDHDAIRKFARKHNLRVIHDAAHSFGSHYKGKKVGSFSDITMFSFDPIKNITCIDGGALVVRTKKERNALHDMRMAGMSQKTSLIYKNKRDQSYDVKRLGFRYHLANLHAAMGLVQLKKIKGIISSRRRVCQRYNRVFKSLDYIRVPETDFKGIAPFLYYVRVEEHRRRKFREHLLNRGVETGMHWTPGHWFTLFRNMRRGDLSVTDRVGKELVSLPLHPFMKEQYIQRVIEAVASFK